MLELVTLLLTMVEGQKARYLDMRKPLQWCFVAYFLLMQTSIDSISFLHLNLKNIIASACISGIFHFYLMYCWQVSRVA